MSILRRKNPKAKDADLYFILSLSSHDDNGSPKFKSATTYAPSPRVSGKTLCITHRFSVV